MENSLPKKRNKRSIIGICFIMPLVVYFVIFQLAPIFISFFISLTDWDWVSTPNWVGLDNYISLLTDKILYPDFWKSIGVTFLYMLLTVPISIVLAVIVGAILNSNIKGERFFKTAFYIPCVTAGVAISAIWLYLIDPGIGLVGWINKSFGTSINLLGSTSTALPTLAVMSIWGGLGYNVLIVLSSMKNINRQLYDACEVDGGNFFHKLFHVTIPGIMPTIYFMIITSVISSLQAFDQMYLMTGGGPEGSTSTFMLSVYKMLFDYQEVGTASAMSYFLFFIIVAVTFIQSKVLPQGYQVENKKKNKTKEVINND